MPAANNHASSMALVAPVYPLVSGAAQFNTAMLAALRDLSEVEALSWRRLYPPLLHRRDSHDAVSRPTRVERATRLLDWADPRTWRRALDRIVESGARALIIPWLHPVMAPPYRYLLSKAPSYVTRVVICHNVRMHSRVPFERLLSRAVLSRADLLVTHSSHQLAELTALGLVDIPVLHSFHPLFEPANLSIPPSDELIRAERQRQGDPDLSLLAFGAVRPYKGLDLGLEALALVPDRIKVKLVIAGAFWNGTAELAAKVRELGLEHRVELIDGYQSNEQAALRFLAADASYLPYRSASQSGVVALSFAYARPVIATAVGGLLESVADGQDGLLVEPDNPHALADAVVRMAEQKGTFNGGALRPHPERSFRRYAEMLHEAVEHMPSGQPAGETLSDARSRVA